jgi:hypothetical protein
MPTIVYRIVSLLKTLLRRVPVGTNLGLLHLFWALMSGRFLSSRGAIFPALSDLGLSAAAVRRSSAALTYGRFECQDLVDDWKQAVEKEGTFQPHSHDGLQPVPVDLVGFFRPRLEGCATKHYTSQANKALPAIVFGMVGATGSVGKSRFCLPRLFVPMQPGETSEADLQKRTLDLAALTLSRSEVLILDAGFCLADLLALDRGQFDSKAGNRAAFVLRGPKNFTARKNALPTYKGKGRPPEKGDIVRPLSRKYKKKTLPATPAEGSARFKVGGRMIRALFFDDLVLTDAKPGSPSFRCVVYFDPRYEEPLILVTNLPKSVSARALWHLYRDRWPIEQLPLAGKQMLGAERSFVFAPASQQRLPLLALLAGNVLSYVAASSAPVATGFWDRVCRPTCGRLRRVLARLNFSELAFPEGEVRKKASFTAHLLKGVRAHRRSKAVVETTIQRLAA